jgi:hypothetical protein
VLLEEGLLDLRRPVSDLPKHPPHGLVDEIMRVLEQSPGELERLIEPAFVSLTS